jgi:putative ABC transport system permease protein
MIRIAGDPAPIVPVIRKLVSGIDQNVAEHQVETLEQELSDSIAPRRFNMLLLTSFATIALLLAVVGIYGVIAYAVAQRSHEIGIRMAIGARRTQILGMVIRQGMVIVMTGVVLGVLASLALGRVMISLLYGVKPNDPAIFVAVAAALSLVALLACWVPAVKAARLDPMIALRYD